MFLIIALSRMKVEKLMIDILLVDCIQQKINICKY